MSDIGLIVADPGHFHAALVQREMYPNLSPEVHVYAPVGPDLIDYLTRISRFNTRPERPTRWGIEVHACPDFLERMCRERPGTVAMFSGRNRSKIQGILAAIEAGINVLADKPLIIRREDLSALELRTSALQTAYPGVSLAKLGREWRVTIPDALRIGHEAHFAQMTRNFLDHVEHRRPLPAREKPNTLAKYFVCTEGVGISQG